MEKAGFVQEQEDHVLLPNRSPAALLHVCDPTPERPPLRLSHLRTPPPLTYSSILPTPRPREGQCRTGSSELRAHPQLRWALHLGPKPFPAAHRGEGERERETPQPEEAGLAFKDTGQLRQWGTQLASRETLTSPGKMKGTFSVAQGQPQAHSSLREVSI